MRIVVVSDTHDQYAFEVPDGDVLLHCGDFTENDRADEYQRFNTWMASQAHKHKIVIAGNHEFSLEGAQGYGSRILRSVTYLQDSACEIEGLKFWGSPWQPWFYDFAFNFPPDDEGNMARLTWSKIPIDTDVLITHGPPRGILDRIPGRNVNVGCPDLLQRVQAVRPLIHAFGHIHVANGIEKIGETVFVNAAICDEQYRPWRPPHVVEIVNGVSTIVQ